MNNTDDLATQYLNRLDRAARNLPKNRRKALRQQVAEHFQSVSEEGGDVAAERARLGDPEDLVAAEMTDGSPASSGRRVLAVVLLVLACLWGAGSALVLVFTAATQSMPAWLTGFASLAFVVALLAVIWSVRALRR